MARQSVIPGRVLTPADKMRRYRENPKNKAKIKEYEKSERRVNAKRLRDMTVRKEKDKIVFKGQKRKLPSNEVEDSDQEDVKDDEKGGRRRHRKRSHASILEKKKSRAEQSADDQEDCGQKTSDMIEHEEKDKEHGSLDEADEDGAGTENMNTIDKDEDWLFHDLGRKKKVAIKKTGLSDLSKKSRQAIIGEKIRRENQDKMKMKLEAMAAEMRNLKREKVNLERVNIEKDVVIKIVEKKLEKKAEEVEKLKEDKTSDNNWIKFVYRNLSASARKEFKRSVNFNKGNFSAGTLSRLRQSVGVNFSQVPTEERTKLCLLATKI